MSKIFVNDIQGNSVGDLKVPATDAELATATSRLDTQLSTVATNLNYARVLAWVQTKDGASAPRTLNGYIERIAYDSGGGDEECPDPNETDTMTAEIKGAIEAYDVPNTIVGSQQVALLLSGEYYLWKRDSSGGFLYPNAISDDIAIGGVAPSGKWFQDGDMVLGAAAMSGTEKLYVVGDELVEGAWLMTEQASSPLVPTTSEGTFWVRNTTPTLPGFTDDAGLEHTLAYVDTDVTSLQGIDQVIFVDKTSGAYAADGTIQLPYNTINAAIAAATALTPTASNRIGIVIYPGIYSEAVVTADDYVDFIGVDKLTTIIQQTSTDSPLEIQNANIIFRNLTFEAASGCTDYVVDVSVAITDRVEFFDCDFLGTNGDAYNYFKSTYGNLDFYRCRLIQGDTAEIIFDDSQATARKNRFFDCELHGVVNLQQSMDVEAYGSRFYSTADGSGFYGCLRIGGTTPDRSFFDCSFKNTASAATAHSVYFNATAQDVWFLGCRFEGGDNATADITGAADCDPVIVKDCWMKHGMDRHAKMTKQATKWCNGAPGDYDYYLDFDEAVQAITTSGSDVDCQIVFLDDFANTGTVAVPGTGRKFVVDGQGLFGITGASQVFIQSAGSDTIKFKRMSLEGEAQLVGNGSSITFDTCNISGALRVVSGDAASRLVVHDSAVRGNSDFVNPVDIRDADPTIVIWTSYVIGYTGNAAVSYNSSVDNDNLQIAYSKIFHGDLGSNNPFTGITSSTQAEYLAHHTAFNIEPDVADSTHYLNNIDSAQRKNTIDADADYTWWAA
jgi:hypothetical protein